MYKIGDLVLIKPRADCFTLNYRNLCESWVFKIENIHPENTLYLSSYKFIGEKRFINPPFEGTGVFFLDEIVGVYRVTKELV